MLKSVQSERIYTSYALYYDIKSFENDLRADRECTVGGTREMGWLESDTSVTTTMYCKRTNFTFGSRWNSSNGHIRMREKHVGISRHLAFCDMI